MFYGRKEELDMLNSLWGKAGASLVVCSGRRRIGKSTLIEEFAARSKCKFIEIEGLPPDDGVGNAAQLSNFCERLARQTSTPEAKAETWPHAFDMLDDTIPHKGHVVVFLDEISWMGAFDKRFPGFLKNAWDTQFSRHDNLIFVICGSVSAWIGKNILNSKGFVGRMSLELELGELPLSYCREFWGKTSERVSVSEMIDLLSITGGVPKYLREINPRYSATENIRRLCFMPQGYLFKDFARIFTDIFKKTTDEKRRLVECIADTPLSLKGIAAALGIPSNGHLSESLCELCQAGFVSVDSGLNPVTGSNAREVRYRISDNYLRFYLKCIVPRQEAIGKGLFKFTSLEQLPGWSAMFGYQFETLIRNNLHALIPKLGLSNTLITSAAPYSIRGTKKGEGAQIDLLIQTRKSVCVVEIKRRSKIDESIETDIQRKVAALRLPKSISVRTALVYEGNLDPQVTENGYFDFIVPVEELL